MSDSTKVRFSGEVTLGNLLAAGMMLIPLVVWGTRLESRVDFEEVLRARLEKTVTEQIIASKERDIRMEMILGKITEDLTAVRIFMGVMRTGEQPPKRETPPSR